MNYVLFNYNNIIQSRIGYKPIEVFYSTSETIIDEVYHNTLNSFKYVNSLSTIFALYEKVLLYNNFIIDKKKSKKK